jgi:hypothetical protein
MAMIHVSRGATNLGAFDEQEVRDGLRTGRFTASDLGWREGMANWQPLSQFSEFAADIGPAPSAPSPTAAASTITPAPAGPMPEAVTPRSGLPWDQRLSKGIFSAFIETLQMVLGRPNEAFTAMKREGGLGDPLLYAIIGGSFGIIVYLIYNFAFQSLGLFANQRNPLTHFVGMGVGGVFLVIFAPVLVVIGTFIGSAIFHVCLMLVGGAKQSFETTFRVVCFVEGSIQPLLIIPFCGGLVVGVWKIVLNCIGVARAHEIETGRAVLAVLLPIIVCCGFAIAAAICVPVLVHSMKGQ